MKSKTQYKEVMKSKTQNMPTSSIVNHQIKILN